MMTKKKFLKELIDQCQRDIWLKEISREYYSLLPGDENKKKAMAADVEIKEYESKHAFFTSLYNNL